MTNVRGLQPNKSRHSTTKKAVEHMAPVTQTRGQKHKHLSFTDTRQEQSDRTPEHRSVHVSMQRAPTLNEETESAVVFTNPLFSYSFLYGFIVHK